MANTSEPKQYAPGEQQWYAMNAGDVTADVPGQLESLRESLSMYPQAFQIVVDAVREMPYDADNEKQDAFIAWKLAEILDSFADRLHAVGVKAVDDPYQHFQGVDLSAAKESDDIDDEAVRQSAYNQGDEDDNTSTAHTDREVAKSAEVADDAAIRKSLDIDGVDAVMDKITSDEVEGMLEGTGVTGDEDEDVKLDVGEDDDEFGGSEAIQLGMLDSAGTQASPERCAKKATEVLYHAMMFGYKDGQEKRSGLLRRMRSLVEHGVCSREEIKILLGKALSNGISARFKIDM